MVTLRRSPGRTAQEPWSHCTDAMGPLRRSPRRAANKLYAHSAKAMVTLRRSPGPSRHRLHYLSHMFGHAKLQASSPMTGWLFGWLASELHPRPPPLMRSSVNNEQRSTSEQKTHAAIHVCRMPWPMQTPQSHCAEAKGAPSRSHGRTAQKPHHAGAMVAAAQKRWADGTEALVAQSRSHAPTPKKTMARVQCDRGFCAVRP